MHVSPLGLHRLFMPLRGAVKVRLVDAEQAAFVYANATSGVPSDVDVFHPNTVRYPALTLVSGYEVTVRVHRGTETVVWWLF